MPIQYHEPVYRPPSEGRSILLQVTIGCSHNLCTYCDMYRSKKYTVRNIEDVEDDLIKLSKFYNSSSIIPEKIFFCDGDALAAPFDYLMKCLELTFKYFPFIKRIGTYATAMNILEKSDNELKQLSQAGMGIAYLGMESGSDSVLKKIVKGNNAEDMVKASLKIKKAGFKLSTIVMIGVGGEELSDDHITGTARILSQCAPEYLSFLVTSPVVGTPMARMIERKIMTLPTEKQMLFEMKEILRLMDDELMNNIVFRANHVSNQIPLAGILPQDKNSLVKKLEYWFTQMPEERRGFRDGHM